MHSKDLRMFITDVGAPRRYVSRCMISIISALYVRIVARQPLTEGNVKAGVAATRLTPPLAPRQSG